MIVIPFASTKTMLPHNATTIKIKKTLNNFLYSWILLSFDYIIHYMENFVNGFHFLSMSIFLCFWWKIKKCSILMNTFLLKLGFLRFSAQIKFFSKYLLMNPLLRVFLSSLISYDLYDLSNILVILSI